MVETHSPLMALFNKFYIQSSVLNKEFRASNKGLLVNIVECFLKNEALHNVLNTTPEALLLLVEVWRTESIDALFDPLVSNIPQCATNMTIAKYLHIIALENHQPFISEAFREEDHVQIVSQTAVACMISDTKHANVKGIICNASVMNHLFANRAIAIAMLTHHSVPAVTKALVHLTSVKPSASLYEEASVGVAETLLSIRKSLVLGDGRAWTIQALDANLLIAIRSAVGYNDHITESAVALLNTLSKYLLFVSVLGAVGRGLEEVEESGLDSVPMLPGSLKDQWQEFSSLALRQIVLSGCTSKQSHKYQCHYVQVGNLYYFFCIVPHLSKVLSKVEEAPSKQV